MVISRESAHILVDSRYFVEVEARAQGYQLHLLDATNTLTTIVNLMRRAINVPISVR